MNETEMPTPATEGSRGSLIGSVIIVLILVIGAIYLYVNRNAGLTPTETATSTETVSNETVPGGTTTPAASDDVTSLEAEAAAMDLGSLDADLKTLGEDFN